MAVGQKTTNQIRDNNNVNLSHNSKCIFCSCDISQNVNVIMHFLQLQLYISQCEIIIKCYLTIITF